jgi:outer membrane protein assembly factor BamD
MKRIRSRSSSLRALLALSLLVMAGCSTRAENLSLVPPDDLFARAEAALESGDIDAAIPLFDYFVIQHIGHPRAPDARMRLAMAHMSKREYATAASHFQRFVNDFPFHERALQARFQTCEAYYQLSPKTPLDQEYTMSAILYCESVTEYYPGTEEARVADGYVRELTNKLAEKGYETGMHYIRRGAFDSAVVYLTDVVTNFPRSEIAPDALARLVEAYTEIGYVEDAEEARERLLREHPQSPQARALAGGI